MSADVIKELIRPELLVLIPVLYFIGMGIKKSETISDKYIPLLLGAFGIFLSVLYVFTTATYGEILQTLFVGITQGILCAGCSVYINQLLKQNGKDDSE